MRIRPAVFIVLIGMLALSACTKSGKMFTLAGMQELSATTTPVDVADYESRFGDNDGVYLLYEKVIEHAGAKELGAAGFLLSTRPTWLYQEIEREKYIVFNPNADWLTTFEIWTKPDELYLRITNPDGTTRSYGLDDLRPINPDEEFPDYQFIFPDVQRGSIIETGYMVDFKVGAVAPREHVVLLQHPIPAEEIRFTYACPSWWEYQLKRSAENIYPVVEIETDTATHKTLISASRHDVPAVQPEPYSPYFREVADHLQLRITRLQMSGASWEAVKDWNEVGKLIRDYKLGKLDDVAFDVVRQANLIVDKEEQPLPKIAAILAWVRDSIEIDHRNRDGSPQKVLRDHKADLFDLTALTSALLKEVRVPNDYLLVHSATGSYFDREYISLDQFNFPALGAWVDNNYYVLLPYVDGLPPGVVPPWIMGQPALKFVPEAVEFVNIPDTNQIPSSTKSQYDLTLDEFGIITVNEEVVMTGTDAYITRDTLRDLNDEELDAFAKDMLTVFDVNLELESFEVHDLADPTRPLRMTFVYTIDNLVTVTPEEVIFQTGGLFSPLSGTQLLDDPEQRVNDVRIMYDLDHQTSIRLHFPPGWTLATPLSDVTRENEFGSVTGKYSLDPGLLTVEQQLQVRRTSRPRSEYAQLLEIAGPKAGLDVPSIVFSVEAPEAVETGSTE